MRVTFATCSLWPEGVPEEEPAVRLLGADVRAWDDDSVDWSAYDRVLLRSVWDYSWRLEEFLGWCEAVGPERLRNSPDTVAFNADKRYLAELQVPTVPTAYVAAGDPLPAADGEIVVKPNVSAGSRDTGRFSSAGAARTLIEEIRSSGRIALVQPYLASVEERGETSVVFIGGVVSHVLNKRAILREQGVAPIASGPMRVAAAMFEEDLVTASSASDAELALARVVVDEITGRFGLPVYARVDIVHSDDGHPLVSEVELIEPRLYLDLAPGAPAALAAALRRS
jgi:glutathione synthase/RimK-type ligase-like ATP-grasp enzyme